MTTIAQFATDHNAQPYEVAAFLNLGADYSDTDELTAEQTTALADCWNDDLDTDED